MAQSTSTAAGPRLQARKEPLTAADLRYRRRALLANRAQFAGAEAGMVMLDPAVTVPMPADQLLAAIGAELARVEAALAAMGETVTPARPQTPPEMLEKMGGMDARVPMANNPVQVPPEIAAMIAKTKRTKGSP